MLKPPFAKLATGVIGGVPSPFGAGKPIIFAISRETQRGTEKKEEISKRTVKK